MLVVRGLIRRRVPAEIATAAMLIGLLSYDTAYLIVMLTSAGSRAGMQSYRTESGKLIKTWLSMQPLGSTWTGTPQEHLTSQPGIA
ncbi:hypothetical protein L3V59_39635 [Burkholderia aenigmatica]|uniref:hypothetical protein n=1 Tax=Burkholderia cepacia complex TaxID=87882 RepID=UPI001F28BBDD|nr:MULTISPECIES: hypothetical protein [Burkholderia cepacia complex]UKD16794.1 hypothetical protein L3V59_39635 [Burkholderia aenigmatica]